MFVRKSWQTSENNFDNTIDPSFQKKIKSFIKMMENQNVSNMKQAILVFSQSRKHCEMLQGSLRAEQSVLGRYP